MIHRDEIADLRMQHEQLRQESRRSAAMTAEIVAAFGEAHRRAQRTQKETDADIVDGVAFGKGAAMLPLGVKNRRVAIRSTPAARHVAATALCADSSQVVVVRLTLDPRNAAHVQDVAGEAEDETSATFLVRLAAGETKRLFEIGSHAAAVEVALCRVGGDPCVLRLELDNGVEGTAKEPSGTGDATSLGGRDRASSKGVLWKSQELIREGRADRAMEVALAYATDVERPALALLRATLATDDADWLANVNAYIEQFGVVPIRLERTNASRFLRLTADAPRSVSGGPLVTVIMPAFNAERTLAHAAGSILKQSWAELELIIVDDCSNDSTSEVAQRVARLDSRAKVIRNNVNAGPYVSKNVALALARGAYITCHDADDWAHPQRIEHQIEAMKRSGARACVASWLRLDEGGAFTGFTSVGRQSHDGALRLAHVTCMIETQFMRRYVGYWDCVRFGADGEMLERLERLLGQDLLRLRHFSVLSLDAPRSLTNDAVYGISKAAGLSPTRRAYRDAWRQWHATLTADAAYVAFPQRGRPFEAPQECVVSRAVMDLVRVDNHLQDLAHGEHTTA